MPPCKHTLSEYSCRDASIKGPAKSVCVCACMLRVNDVSSSAGVSLLQQQMLAYYQKFVFDKNRSSSPGVHAHVCVWVCTCVCVCPCGGAENRSCGEIVNSVWM